MSFRYIRKFVADVALAVVLTCLFPASGASQSACFSREVLLKHLSGKFEEAPIAAGLAANGSVLEVFASPDGVTWTIVLTQPNGATCVMASGESWMGLMKPKREKGA